MHKNAEVVRRGYPAFNAADMKTLAELFDEDASWHTPGQGSIAGDRVGRAPVFAQFGRYGGETGGTFKAEPHHVLADEEGRVVGIHHNSGVRNGKHLDVDCCIVFELKNGRINQRSGALLPPSCVGGVLVVAEPVSSVTAPSPSRGDEG
jgi:ketosteroid isomerase-like protein